MVAALVNTVGNDYNTLVSDSNEGDGGTYVQLADSTKVSQDLRVLLSNCGAR